LLPARTARCARLALPALLVAALLCGCLGERPPERLILIVVDTLRSDHLGVYGAKAPTPNIDALAARGQHFTGVVSAFHQTSMSMAALFTGRTPSLESRDGGVLSWNGHTWCGLVRLAKTPGQDPCIPPDVPTLAEALREAGYWTIGVASNQLLYEPSGFARGFDQWVQVDERPPMVRPASWAELVEASRQRTWTVVNRAVVAALNQRGSDHFFLYVHYVDVHDYQFHRTSYAEAVQSLDTGIGRLLESLEAASLLEGAVVVLTSDHGERLGEAHDVPGEQGPNSRGHYGNPSFQEVLRIPLVVAPARFERPDRFLRGQDVFGLLLEIAGVEGEPAADARPDEHFLSELRYRTYRQGRWKSLVRRADGAHFLFDLETDPLEQREVGRQFPQVLAEHRARIDELSRSLAAGRVPERGLSETDRERLRLLGYLDE
jgi:arylsulfatase A-like enzyme